MKKSPIKRTQALFRPLDGLIILAVLAAAIISGIRIYGNRKDTVHLAIESPSGAWIYDLETDRTVDIPGKLGDTVVRIAGGEARIVESACPNKTCVAAHAIAHKGEWNACLPNEVIIRVAGDGKQETGVDATGY